jgi:hypothetical protein
VAVDLGRARSALAGLAVPPDSQIVGLLGLYLMDGIEHDHLFRDGVVIPSAPPPPSPRQILNVAVVAMFFPRMTRLFE